MFGGGRFSACGRADRVAKMKRNPVDLLALAGASRTFASTTTYHHPHHHGIPIPIPVPVSSWMTVEVDVKVEGDTYVDHVFRTTTTALTTGPVAGYDACAAVVLRHLIDAGDAQGVARWALEKEKSVFAEVSRPDHPGCIYKRTVGFGGGLTPIRLAVMRGNVTMVRALSLFNTDVPDEYGVTSLHLAARLGSETVLDALFEWDNTKPADSADLADGEGNTPLMEAARAGHVNAVRLLLARGANARKTNDLGESAGLMALRGGHKRVHALLIRAARVCAACGAGGGGMGVKLWWCKGCELVKYCSKECQVHDLKSHRELCRGKN